MQAVRVTHTLTQSQEVGLGVECVPRMRCGRCPITTEGKGAPEISETMVTTGKGCRSGSFDEG